MNLTFSREILIKTILIYASELKDWYSSDTQLITKNLKYTCDKNIKDADMIYINCNYTKKSSEVDIAIWTYTLQVQYIDEIRIYSVLRDQINVTEIVRNSKINNLRGLLK